MDIAQRCPATTLADIFSVLAYCLRHQEESKAYLAERQQKAEEVRKRIKNESPSAAAASS